MIELALTLISWMENAKSPLEVKKSRLWKKHLVAPELAWLGQLGG